MEGGGLGTYYLRSTWIHHHVLCVFTIFIKNFLGLFFVFAGRDVNDSATQFPNGNTHRIARVVLTSFIELGVMCFPFVAQDQILCTTLDHSSLHIYIYVFFRFSEFRKEINK